MIELKTIATIVLGSVVGIASLFCFPLLYVCRFQSADSYVICALIALTVRRRHVAIAADRDLLHRPFPSTLHSRIVVISIFVILRPLRYFSSLA